jgi:hypothetical protein
MKTLNMGILCALLALTASSVFAQKPRPRSATKTTSTATKKTATTTKEKTESPAPTKPAPIKAGKIDLEAGLIFKSGDIKPVGRTTFYLLKDNAEKIFLTQEYLDTYNRDMAAFWSKMIGDNPRLQALQRDKQIDKTLDKWSLYEAVLDMDGRMAPNFAVAVKNGLDAAAVVATTTGFDGKATFDNVPVGNYHIFGYYKVGENTTYWNLPITVKPGDNKIILDNDNTRR